MVKGGERTLEEGGYEEEEFSVRFFDTKSKKYKSPKI